MAAAAAFVAAQEQAQAYRYRSAAEEYRRSLQAYATLSAYLNAGLAALNLAELTGAENHFRTGLQLIEERGGHDFVPAFQIGLGVAYRAQGRVDQALAAHRAALALVRQET